MPILEVKTEITGNVWKVLKAAGDRVEEDEAVVILESMKMEIPVTAPEPGMLLELRVKEGDSVSDGDVIARLEV